MVGEWNQTTLGSIAAKDGYGLVDGPFGSNLPASCYVANGVPVIRGSNLTLGTSRFVADEFVFVSRETAERLARSLCRPLDVVFTKKGTLGQTGLVPEHGPYDLYLASSNQMKLTVDRRLADPGFVYYFISSPVSTGKIIRDSEATGVPKINVAYLRNFPITLPPLPEQHAIAHILGALDDKIELNRRMNATLEAMARALFKSWFVDFDPVRAKAEGRDTGLPREIAELSPDEFEESELGEVPKGWRVAAIAQIASTLKVSVMPGKSPTKVWEHYSIPAFDAGRVPILETGDTIKSGKYRVPPTCVLVSKLIHSFRACGTRIFRMKNPRYVPLSSFLLSHDTRTGDRICMK
jgi:type I restriction enzyme, S subunit